MTYAVCHGAGLAPKHDVWHRSWGTERVNHWLVTIWVHCRHLVTNLWFTLSWLWVGIDLWWSSLYLFSDCGVFCNVDWMRHSLSSQD